MSAGAVRAGAAFVEIFANDSKFQQALTRMQNKLKATAATMRTIGAGLMGAGAAIATPILAAAGAFASLGSELFDMSQRTGIAAESLSVLKYAAEQSGTDMASLETSVRKMQKTIDAAGSGSKEASDALARIGLSAADLAGMKPEDQMAAIADGLMAIQDPGERAAIAMAIFGKSGTAVLPMLAGGSAGMRQFAAEAARLGLIMDSETAAKADALGDALDSLRQAMFMAFINVGSAVAPMLTSIAKYLADVSAKVGQFIQNNQQLITTALKVAAGVVALGGAFMAASFMLTTFSAAIGVIKAALTLIPALCTPVGVALGIIAGGVTLAVVAGRQLSPAFKKETDAIWKAITKLDFASAWKIMNLNFAIALVEMGGKASEVLGQIKGFFAAAGSFIGDKMVEGLDRFMGLFGADILTLQGGLEKLGLYFRAAFDWKWAVTGLNKALKEVDDRMEKERNRSPTADSRAEDRAGRRQREADQRQADMDNAATGWQATADALRDELRGVHDAVNASTEAQDANTQATARPAGVEIPEITSAVAGATQGFGQSLGTFSTSAAGISIGPELSPLEDAAQQTAGNTAEANQHLASIDNKLAAPSATGSSAIANSPAVATVPTRSQQAQAGTAAAASGSTLNDAFASAIAKVVEAVNAHAKISATHTPLLNTIAKNTASGGLAFS